MRSRFFAGLVTAATKNPDIVLITGDLGFGVIGPFLDVCPGQFINAGVAEQNMTGLAAGIALAGGKVFTYSIANFPTLRCLEQIRNDIAYHGADVTVVAVGGGLAYGALGMSHHATEDLAVMRAIPGVAVAAPGDPVETDAVVAELLANGGPAYLRLGKAGERDVHPGPVRFERGQSIELRAGGDVAIFSTGAILEVACAAADLLAGQGVRASVRSFPWLDPLDIDAIQHAARRYEAIVTIEEHSIVGGLGSAVAEVLAELPAAAPLVRVALPARFTSVVGDQDYLRSVYGLDPGTVSRRVLTHLEESHGLARQVH
jgi:transketolase